MDKIRNGYKMDTINGYVTSMNIVYTVNETSTGIIVFVHVKTHTRYTLF